MHDYHLGANGPMPINVPNSSAQWLLQVDKDGNAHVLNRANLGGIGGSAAVQQVAAGLTRSAPASWTPPPDGVYVTFEGVGTS